MLEQKPFGLPKQVFPASWIISSKNIMYETGIRDSLIPSYGCTPIGMRHSTP